MKAFSGIMFAILPLAMGAPTSSIEESMRRHVLSPREWVRRDGDIDSNTRVAVRIALAQRNLEKGMDYLLEVSDPASPKYGQHYTADEVKALFAPAEGNADAVKQWLVESGVAAGAISTTKSGGWVDFSTDIGHLESMLQAKYHAYGHISGAAQQISAEQYVLPEKVKSFIDFIAPAHILSGQNMRQIEARELVTKSDNPHGPVKQMKPIPDAMVQTLKESTNSTYQYCAEYMTPTCISALYKIPRGKLSDPSNRMGIFETNYDYPLQSDLTLFFGLFAPQIPATEGPKVDLIDFSDTKPVFNSSGAEATLDFDVAYPIIYPQSTELYQTNATGNFAVTGAFAIFNQFLDAVDGAYCTSSAYGETGDDPKIDGVTEHEQCGTFKPANAISFSYAWSEASYPVGYVKRQCDEFMKLGLQGSTLLFASGDAGVAGPHGGACLGKKKDIFAPLVAAACPYVTTVGATIIPSGGLPGDQEVATSSFSSGGGFSNVWTTPLYQQKAVQSYLADHNPGFPAYTTSNGTIPASGHGVYNKAGRAYPDISAVGDNGVVVTNGKVGRNGGTSMSTPIVTAMFTRINDERLAKGKKPIGFVNPALYNNPAMFNDITIGDMSTNGECDGKGFSCTPGWDPVTGLGTPKYPEMLDYFMSLP